MKSIPFTFVLINIHTDPDDAEEEIYTLEDVVVGARNQYTGRGRPGSDETQDM